ncbi:hypothetical protein LXM25_15685 [Dyadobacter sp. LJ53]|uniref:hypothetical protein n=1 Tax=Dyadobacter chenwenxiniae TaxID=2906456 RepID=UPI001F3A3E74|nr:hypothetical protein [Dyadobacter chenwenxiniae]MCF0051509.1 hypothetical protein [Dyadobacter chenwenxiniae]
MPAKKEYLTPPGQRALKITAGLFGGYFLAVAVHMLLAVALPYRMEIILTGAFSVFLLWTALMIIAFLMRNGWIVWGIYLLSIIFCAAGIYLLK